MSAEQVRKIDKNKIKKIYKFLFTIIIILLFLTISLNSFVEEDMGNDIQSMLGQEYSASNSLSVRENLILRGSIDLYIQNIYSGDLESAYDYLLPQYKEYVTEEIYIAKMQEIGLENFVIQNMSITRHTENLFSFDVQIQNENKLKLLVLLSEKKYYIVPEPFLEYEKINKEITKKDVTYLLKGYEVDLERCVFDMVLTNSSNKEVEIYDVKMTNTEAYARSAVNSKITLAPNETKEISFIVETDLYFPTKLEITRKDGNKLRVYTFEF